MQFKSLLYFVSVITVAFGATTQDVVNDLTAVGTQVTTLNNGINKFASSKSLLDALAIHTDATNTESAIDKTTTDAKTLPIPVSLADGTTILSTVQNLVPGIQSSLTAIVAQKANFQALPLGNVVGLVKSDLAALNASNSALEVALVQRAPSQLLPQATAVVNELNAAFATAIAAYA